MLARERQLYILQKLGMQPAITASQLADELNCSRSTIQRDLTVLDGRGPGDPHVAFVAFLHLLPCQHRV